MSLLDSKKIQELEAENTELRNSLRKIYDKEEKVKQLEEIVKRIRKEVSGLSDRKSVYLSDIDKMKKEMNQSRLEIDKLTYEIDKLREIKNEEQTNLLSLTSQIEELQSKDYVGKESTISSDNQEQVNDYKAAKEKTEELNDECKILDAKIDSLNKKIATLNSEEISLQARIDEKRSKLKKMDNKEFEKIKDDIGKIEDIIINSKDEEIPGINDIQERIKNLKAEETRIDDRINVKARELEKIERDLIRKSLIAPKQSEEKLLSLINEEKNLIESIEKKNNKISELNTIIKALEDEKHRVMGNIKQRIHELKAEELKIQKQISDENDDLKRGKEIVEITNELELSLKRLEEKETNLKNKIQTLEETEQNKRKNLAELNNKIASGELEFASMGNDYDLQLRHLNESGIKNKELSNRIEFKKKELLTIDQSIESKTEQLKELDKKIESLNSTLLGIQVQISGYEELKSETDTHTREVEEKIKALDEKHKKLNEIIPQLEQRRIEIQQGNKSLEERFANMFHQYSKELSDINKKRAVLEQIIDKKAKDLDEKDRLLLEKVTALDESERVLNIRYTEIDSFDELLNIISEQKDLIKNDLLALDRKTIEKRNHNKELSIESDTLLSKITAFENDLLMILNNSGEKLKKTFNRRTSLEKEIKEYENRLNELNLNIKDSMNELVELQSSISNIKIEHEEHRLNITKLAAMKKRLESEIGSHQTLLQKYRQIREKIKLERDTIISRKEQVNKTDSVIQEKIKNGDLQDITKIIKL